MKVQDADKVLFKVLLSMDVWPWVSFAFTVIFFPSPTSYRLVEYKSLKYLGMV